MTHTGVITFPSWRLKRAAKRRTRRLRTRATGANRGAPVTVIGAGVEGIGVLLPLSTSDPAERLRRQAHMFATRPREGRPTDFVATARKIR